MSKIIPTETKESQKKQWWEREKGKTFYSGSALKEQRYLSNFQSVLSIGSLGTGVQIAVTPRMMMEFGLSEYKTVFGLQSNQDMVQFDCIEAIYQLFKYIIGSKPLGMKFVTSKKAETKKRYDWMIQQFTVGGHFAKGKDAKRAGGKGWMTKAHWQLDALKWTKDMQDRVMRLGIYARATVDAEYRKCLVLAKEQGFVWQHIETRKKLSQMYWGGASLPLSGKPGKKEYQGINRLGQLMNELASHWIPSVVSSSSSSSSASN